MFSIKETLTPENSMKTQTGQLVGDRTVSPPTLLVSQEVRL